MKAEAFLLSGESFNFTFDQQSSARRILGSSNYGQSAVSNITLAGAKVSAMDDSVENRKLCGILTNFLLQYSEVQRIICITFSGNAGQTPRLGFQLQGEILYHLMCLLGDGIQLQLEISEAEVAFPSVGECMETVTCPETSHTKFNTSVSAKDVTFHNTFSKLPNRWKPYWAVRSLPFSAKLTLKISGDLVLSGGLNGCCRISDPLHAVYCLSTMRDMLNGQVEMDTVIVANDGSEFRCHSSVITAYSPVLKIMLDSEFVEGKSKRVEMDDMSKGAIKQFLAWHYFGDVKEATDNCTIAMELLTCSHKYSIDKLEGVMKSIIIWKYSDWTDVAGAIRLFFFAKNVEEFSDIKRKALLIMRRNCSKLLTCPDYSKLLNEEPEGFKTLTSELILLDD